MKLTLDSFYHAQGQQTNNVSPYFIDRLFTEEQQRQLRSHDAFRFAADIISRTNKEYSNYLSMGDMRLRIVSVDGNVLYLGDLAGIPVAKVYIDSHVDGSDYVYQVAHSIKERGADHDKISSKKMGIAIKSLFSRNTSNTPRILMAMRSTWESHCNITYNNINYSNHRVLSENGCTRPENEVRWSREVAEFLLDYHAHSGDNPPMPTIQVADALRQEKARLDKDRNYYNLAVEIAKEAFGDERWVVIRTQPGFVIGKVKVDPMFLVNTRHLSDSLELTMPFVFVRKFEELEAINPGLHEQFMGAYVMMRAAEPTFANLTTLYNCKHVPFSDTYLKNTHTIAYFQTGQRFDGSVSLSFRALA